MMTKAEARTAYLAARQARIAAERALDEIRAETAHIGWDGYNGYADCNGEIAAAEMAFERAIYAEDDALNALNRL